MRYARYVDGSDVAGGHGTHVCGTLVGDATGDGASKLQLSHVPNAHTGTRIHLQLFNRI